MATKTLLKDITIRDKKKALEFVKAVEKIGMSKTSIPDVEFRRNVRTLSKEQIIKIFGTK